MKSDSTEDGKFSGTQLIEFEISEGEAKSLTPTFGMHFTLVLVRVARETIKILQQEQLHR